MSTFDELLNELQQRMVQSGHPVKIVSKDRSQEEQSKLYSQGRSNKGPIVTEKSGQPGDESKHQLGIAADLAFQNPGDQSWDLLGKNAKDLGLTWGGDWKSLVDKPHVELGAGTQMPETDKVIITDANGNIHRFPPGFDRKRAESIVAKTVGQQAQQPAQPATQRSPVPPDALTRFLDNLGSTINPMNAVKAIPAMIPGTEANAQATLAGLKERAEHPLLSAAKQELPLSGGAGVDAGTKIGQGDVAGGLGQATGDVFNASLPIILPKVPEAAQSVGGGVIKVAKAAGPPVVGAALGHYFGGPLGALAGAFGETKYGFLRKALDKVRGADEVAGEIPGGGVPPPVPPPQPTGFTAAETQAIQDAAKINPAYADVVKQSILKDKQRAAAKPTQSKSINDLVNKVTPTPDLPAPEVRANPAAEVEKPAPSGGLKIVGLGDKENGGPLSSRPPVSEYTPNVERKIGAETPAPPIESRRGPTGKIEPNPYNQYPASDTFELFDRLGVRFPGQKAADVVPKGMSLVDFVRENQGETPGTVNLDTGYKGTLPEEVSGPMDSRKSLSRAEQAEWDNLKKTKGLTDNDLVNWLTMKMMGEK